jgi:deoxyhypusine synthase
MTRFDRNKSIPSIMCSSSHLNDHLLKSVKEAVFLKSDDALLTTETVRGYDFEQGLDYDAILDSYSRIGYQATSLSQAIQEINRMLHWRLSDEPISAEDAYDKELSNLEYRQKTTCTIFLGYTSNLVSSGLREVIRYLVQNHMVNCIVTTAGGIEEDFIKCLAPTYVGDFHLSGASLRQQGLNRIGNLLVPNNNYERFENWLLPILDQCVDEQMTQGVIWTPSKLIHRLGKEINHPDSIYYWAYKVKKQTYYYRNISIYKKFIYGNSSM